MASGRTRCAVAIAFREPPCRVRFHLCWVSLVANFVLVEKSLVANFVLVENSTQGREGSSRDVFFLLSDSGRIPAL